MLSLLRLQVNALSPKAPHPLHGFMPGKFLTDFQLRGCMSKPSPKILMRQVAYLKLKQWYSPMTSVRSNMTNYQGHGQSWNDHIKRNISLWLLRCGACRCSQVHVLHVVPVRVERCPIETREEVRDMTPYLWRGNCTYSRIVAVHHGFREWMWLSYYASGGPEMTSRCRVSVHCFTYL